MNFLYCNDVDTKEKLISRGYSLISEKVVGDKKVFLFANNKTDKITFDDLKVFYTNKMTF